jgi:hypothetical protein
MTIIDKVSQTEAPAPGRNTVLGGVLAILLSANAFLALVYGALGATGNPKFTGGLLIASELAILFLAMRRTQLLAADYLFGFFVLCIAASFTVNGAADFKETTLLVISLAAYPVCRFVGYSGLDHIKTSFSAVTTALVAIGTIVTLRAIIDQWPVARGKPVVLGFDAASTYFAIGLSLCLLAAVTVPLTLRRTLIISTALILPAAILAAAMVRFSLLAAVCALCLACLLSRGRQRVYTLIVVAVTIAAISSGLVSRMDMTKKMMILSTEQATPSTFQRQNADETSPAIVPPSCGFDVSGNNSIAIRKAVLGDGLYLLPVAGPFGVGLDGFLKFTCVSGTQVHVSILQATIEFGWLGGIAFILLIWAAAAPLSRLSSQNDNAKFAFCSLCYCAALTMAHGRISRDWLLFATIGLAVGVHEALKRKTIDSPVRRA